ncbi:TlpA family protein disulfide reductase [Desulfovibrio sulfodismutans]|uniref:TlpA family protein disulfide reductase n=1 Tax=Desulfolutivibrio sulfodismutans TaxID=63561 RepID=A0A7K3NLE2_9BACT|nr:TlpA disulfide reductase family protein [Desulfolutivibrio sulfodismutans]NDY57014.1 TlpA family protein disulfide reductase [Desulfolutivibrio sulfodismutans]QLA12690.1 redoxin domain-containing protein [Desulfolutivibrio sulfodismutans DSM 3696]
MKKAIWALVLAALALWSAPAWAGGASEAAGSEPLPVGAAFPDVSLGADLSPEHRAYLGIAKKSGPVRLADVSAPVVILEIFSMYCPHCQREAPVLNDLYGLLASGGHADRVKMLGIGAGNSAMEVELFRAKFDIRFPLAADQNFTVHDACGKVGTPYFYVLARKPGETAYTVVGSRLGRMDSPESFAADVLADAP